MRYYLIKLLTNTQEQDGSKVEVYNSKNSAMVNYHNTLAAYHNADDVLYAVVQVVNMAGNCEIMEIVDHRPAPEPEEQAEE